MQSEILFDLLINLNKLHRPKVIRQKINSNLDPMLDRDNAVVITLACRAKNSGLSLSPIRIFLFKFY